GSGGTKRRWEAARRRAILDDDGVRDVGHGRRDRNERAACVRVVGEGSGEPARAAASTAHHRAVGADFGLRQGRNGPALGTTDGHAVDYSFWLSRWQGYV